MKSTIKLCIATLGLATLPATAEVTVNGFGNFVGGMTLGNEESVYGYDDTASFDADSLVALQVRGNISPELSATAQIIGRGSDSYDGTFEWAYITYKLNGQTNLSAGRFRLPLFKYSASVDVGYSYHWIAPPQAVYDVPYNNIDGVRLDYADYAGDWEYRMQVSAGSFGDDVSIAGSSAALEINNILAASVELQRDWFSVRGLYGRGSVSASSDSLNALVGGLEQFSGLITQAGTVADKTALKDDTGQFIEFAIDIDQYDWFVGAEYVHVTVKDSLIAKTDSWYVTAGMRLGAFTPSLTFEKAKEDSETLASALTLPAAIQSGDASTDATWAYLRNTVVGLHQGQTVDTKAITAGVRYDVSAGLAVKGGVTWYKDNLDSERDATLLRVGVNFTF